MDLRALSRLESLQLYGNPLEFLPELSPCTNLRHLSLANVRISADAAFTQWDVEVTATSYISRGNKLAQLFALIFRRSSCQQPLLAGALGKPPCYTLYDVSATCTLLGAVSLGHTCHPIARLSLPLSAT